MFIPQVCFLNSYQPSTNKCNLGMPMSFQKTICQHIFTMIVTATAQLQVQLTDLETKSASHCSSLKSLHQSVFSNLYWGWSGGGPVGSTKCLYAPVLLQNAMRMQDTGYPENSCFKGGSRNHPLQKLNHTSVLCGWKELWAGILWTWVEVDYWTERAGTY